MRSVHRRHALALFVTAGASLLVTAPAAAHGTDITVDANTTSWSCGAASLTWSHTVANKTNRILAVRVAVNNTTTVSSVTFGGAALAQALTFTGVKNHGTVEVWYLIAPTVGTANVVVTVSASVGMARRLRKNASERGGFPDATGAASVQQPMHGKRLCDFQAQRHENREAG